MQTYPSNEKGHADGCAPMALAKSLEPKPLGITADAPDQLPGQALAEHHALLDAAIRAIQQLDQAAQSTVGDQAAHDAMSARADLFKRVTAARNLLYYREPVLRAVQVRLDRLAVECAEQVHEIGATLPRLQRAADEAAAELAELEAARAGADAAASESQRARAAAAAPIHAAEARHQQCAWAFSQALDTMAAAATGQASFGYAAQAFGLLITYVSTAFTTLQLGTGAAPQPPRIQLPDAARPHAPTWMDAAGEVPANLVQRSVLARSIDYDALFAECCRLLQGAAQPAACTT